MNQDPNRLDSRLYGVLLGALLAIVIANGAAALVPGDGAAATAQALLSAPLQTVAEA